MFRHISMPCFLRLAPKILHHTYSTLSSSHPFYTYYMQMLFCCFDSVRSVYKHCRGYYGLTKPTTSPPPPILARPLARFWHLDGPYWCPLKERSNHVPTRVLYGSVEHGKLSCRPLVKYAILISRCY